jgi:branched-chain amino acid transport system ATP-binding protein
MRPDKIARRGIGRTFQIVRPFPSMTVLENLMVSAIYGMRRAPDLDVARREAAVILEELGLAGRSDDLASELTLAGRKRLEIARALALAPRLLLLDEVLAGLTPVEVSESIEMLRAVQARRSLTLVFIEHNMRALMELCGRIVVLHHGERIAEGTPAEVSRNESVIAAYLGTAP